MKVYDNDYLKRHGEDFAANRIGAHGVTLLQYLEDPERYQHLALEHEPLLDRQRAVQAALDAEASVADLKRVHEAPIEPMKHRRHPRARSASDFTRRER